MALNGTLKDFGIADILQLIGQQQKTGVLTLKQRGQEVAVTFKDGNIIRAEANTRDKKALIGTMLVAAGVVSQQQLDFALETQKRTLQRLGDVLVGQGVLTAEKFSSMVQLQTSETLFKLFTWQAGTYAFEQKEVEADVAPVTLRAESVLMEGFRRVDEWPVVRKRITSLQMTFEKLKELPPPELEKDAFDAALDDAFAEEKKTVNKGEFQSVGENERKVYGLIAPGRTVQRIIELSMLGEFEAAKALCNLINLEFVRGVAPTTKGGEDFDSEARRQARTGFVVRSAMAVLGLAAAAFLVSQLELGDLRLGRTGLSLYADPAAQRFASSQQLSRVNAAIELYRLEKGGLPIGLTALVDEGLLQPDDLRFPWKEEYFYRRGDDGTYVLLPPLR